RDPFGMVLLGAIRKLEQGRQPLAVDQAFAARGEGVWPQLYFRGSLPAHRRARKDQEIAARETEVADACAAEVEKVLAIARPRVTTGPLRDLLQDELVIAHAVRADQNLQHAGPPVDHGTAQTQE